MELEAGCMPKRTFNRLDDDKKERVIRAAIEEFQTRGFEKAKIEVIAQNADVAKGSIYQYFEDKRELFLYSVTWSVTFFMKMIDKQTPLSDMDVYEYFLSGCRERLEMIQKEPMLASFSIDIALGKYGSLTEEINKELTRVSEEYELALIANGKKRGTIRDDVDDKTLLMFYQGVTEKFIAEVLAMAKDFKYELTEDMLYGMEGLMKNMVSLLKKGMGQ
jgi:AcrR family transcriptional regulator